MKRPQRKREPHTLAGAYAMDAITAADRARFERHLASCAECAQEIASLREATARLATATAQAPPPGLKERVMAAAATTRQRSPVTADVPARSRSVRVRGAWIRTRAWLGSLAWRGRLVVAAGAVATVAVLGAAVVFGVSNGTMRQQLSQAQASSQQVAAVLTAQDARMMTGPVAGGGTVTMELKSGTRSLHGGYRTESHRTSDGKDNVCAFGEERGRVSLASSLVGEVANEGARTRARGE